MDTSSLNPDILRQSQNHTTITSYQVLLENITDMVSRHTPEGYYLDASSSAYRLLGYLPEELIGHSAYEFFHPDDLALIQQSHKAILVRPDIDTVEYRIRRRDGEYIWFETTSRAIKHPQTHEVIEIVAVSRDITTRKDTEARLRQSEANLRIMFNSLWQAFVLIDYNYRVIDSSESGKKQAEILFGKRIQPGDSIYDYVFPQDIALFMDNFQRAFAGEVITVQKTFNSRHGSVIWAEVTYYPVRDDNGTIVCICMSSIDITRRKQAELALQQSEARLRSLLDSQTAYVMRVDLKGNHTYFNQPYGERYGWVTDELLGYPVIATVIPADVDKALQAGEACLAQPGKPVQVTLRKPAKHGGIYWTFWEFTALQDSDGQIREIQCMGFDITKEKMAEEALRRSQTHLHLTLQGTEAGTWEWSIPTGQTTFDSRWVEMLGYTLEELSPTTIETWSGLVYPDDLQTAISLLSKHFEGELDLYDCECRMKHKQGHWVWVLTRGKVIEWTEHNEPLRMMGIHLDITERKQRETFALENERLKIQFQKEREQNTIVQRVISALSHDLRNSLAVVLASKDMLSRYIDQLTPTQRAEKLTTIGRQIQFSLNLLNDTVLMIQGKLDETLFNPVPVNLVNLCQISVDEFSKLSKTNHRLHFVNNTPHYNKLVAVDEVLITRILLNLFSNAIKYSPDGSEIRLELQQNQDCILLQVVDQGQGISPNDLEHIFEPFYRSEQVTNIQGTGLGLSIVKDCVKRHNGEISVESELGKGTTFSVKINVS